MTTVHADASQRIQNIDDLRARFEGSGNEAGHIGGESEFIICDEKGEHYATPATIAQMMDHLKKMGHSAQAEACGVVEINTPPFPIQNIEDFYDACDHAENDLIEITGNIGHIILNTSVPPFIKLQDAEERVIPRDRILDMIESVKTLLPPDALRVGLLTASSQISIDYKDTDDLYRKLHRGYALSPLLISLFASDTGRIEGEHQPHHIRSALYKSYGLRHSGVPLYFGHCRNGDEFVSAHVNHILNTAMLYYYDGEKVIYPSSLSKTFNELSKEGLDTERNIETAESFVYHDIKLKPLPDGKRRLEFRLVDAGIGHMKAAGALISTLVYNEETAQTFDHLLKKYGFTGALDKDLPLLVRNRDHAVRSPGSINIPFGNGTLRELLSDIRDKILPLLSRDTHTQEILNNLLDNCRVPLTIRYRSMSNDQLQQAIRQP